MLQQPPPPPVEELPPAPGMVPDEPPPDVIPPPAPPPEPPPMGPPGPPPPPPPTPAQMQAAEAKQQLDQANGEVDRRMQTLQIQEQTDQNKVRFVIDQIRAGTLTEAQAEPLLQRFQQESQQRQHDWNQLTQAKQELGTIEQRVGLELMEQHRRHLMEPVAAKMAVQGLVDEAAAQSGDPDAFPKTRLRKLLERTSPDSWRAIQQMAIEDFRDQRLSARAASGVDEMGGTGTAGGASSEADALTNLTAGLSAMFPYKSRR